MSLMHDTLPPRLSKAIVILGAPRSGTTFLTSVLGEHRDLAAIDEPRFIWRYGNDCKSDMLRAADARDNVKRYIRNWFDQYVAEAGRKRLLEKSPQNSVRPAFVNAILPDCRFIHIVRSPIDSILSNRGFWEEKAVGHKVLVKGRIRQRFKEISFRRMPFYSREILMRFAPKPLARLFGRNLWGTRIPGLRAMVNELDLLEVVAFQWRTCVEIARRYGRSLPSDRYFELRLEDITPDLMRRLLDFCELDEDQAVWDRFHEQYDPTRAVARQSSASPEDIDRILRWIEPTMQWYGYDVPTPSGTEP